MRKRKLILIALTLLAVYVVSFFLVLRRTQLSTITSNGEMRSIQLCWFSEDPSVNTVFFYTYFPIHYSLPNTTYDYSLADSREVIQTAENFQSVFCLTPVKVKVTE